MPITVIDITSPDADLTSQKYYDVGGRVNNLEPEFENVLRYLEWLHKRHFGRVRGKRGYERYVDTGRLKASLTQPNATRAIREAHAHTLRFGSRWPHAVHLTKAPLDPKNAQRPKYHRPDLLYAVFVLGKKAQRRVANMLLDYTTEDFGRGT